MQIHCPSCKSKIAGADINVQTTFAKCGGCNSVFDFRSQLGAAEPKPAPRAPVALPAKFAVSNEGGTLRITWQWRNPAAYFLLFFCIAWDGFLVFWFFMASAIKAPLIFILFPIIHVAVGIGLTYFMLCLLVNRTTISVGSDLLGVRHFPLAWPGQKQIVALDVEQVYCTERRGQSKNGTPMVSYDVNAIVSGAKVKLVGGLQELEQALYLETAIEGQLNIENRPVAGEVRA